LLGKNSGYFLTFFFAGVLAFAGVPTYSTYVGVPDFARFIALCSFFSVPFVTSGRATGFSAIFC
jgi:hypothetical protein